MLKEMKLRKNILTAVAFSVLAIAAASCVKTQEEIFDAPSSERLDDYINSARELLKSPADGWVLEYYAGTGQSNGGYTYIVKFSDTEVTASWEREPGKTVTSFYKMTNDNGPVLSFDTHNEILHYFATPSAGKYEALGGDFEFTIMKQTKEEVILLGKRSGNYCYLTPYDKNESSEKYLSDIAKMSTSIKAATFAGKIGDVNVTGKVDLNHRALTFFQNEGKDDEVKWFFPFRFTESGISGYQEMEIGGVKFRDFYYNEISNMFTNGVIFIVCKVPEDYTEYSDFIGEFTLKYSGGSANVTLAPNAAGDGIIMSGLNKNFDVELSYDKAAGCLNWCTQTVGANGGNSIVLCALDNSQGYLTWAEGAGVYIKRNVNVEGEYKFVNNGGWEGYNVDSFILWELDGSGNSVGEFTSWGSGRYFQLKSLTRK